MRLLYGSGHSVWRLYFAVAVSLAINSVSVLMAADETAPGSATKQNSATTPVFHSGTTAKHEKINARAEQGDVDLIFIGDSITEGWAGRGKSVWEKYYDNRKAMNAGVGGDRTQHVLWRLDNGNIEGIHPKLAVIMIGTNNVGSNTPEDVAEGIKAIVQKVREKLPETKILLLGIFPRGQIPEMTADISEEDRAKAEAKLKATKFQREQNAKASKLASEVADNKMVFYMDIGPKFLDAEGVLSKDIMPDYLHPNAKGYEIWAEAIEPKVAELLGEKK
ncbi:MAG TPA: GDSL-type esterase/lipase family protein [Pirellulales bacterium]